MRKDILMAVAVALLGQVTRVLFQKEQFLPASRIQRHTGNDTFNGKIENDNETAFLQINIFLIE